MESLLRSKATTSYCLKENIYVRDRSGVIQLIDINSEDNQNVYFELDAFAARTFTLLMQKLTKEEVVKMIQKESGQGRNIILLEINALIEILLKHEIIEEKK